ncbi:MAG: HlyD family efflux transporter periplasmic adaptor subunit [Bryobacteraceae bacterium]
MKKLIPIVLVLATAGFLAWRFFNGAADPNGSIHLSGNIEATQVDVSFPMPGKVVAIEVREGDAVRKGMVVARLDPEILERQKLREQSAADGAEGVLAQVRTMIDWQRQTVDRDRDLRQAEIRQAEARLRDLEAGARPQEVAQAEAALEQARTEHTRAKADWDRAQTLYKNEDISTQQFDQFRSRFDAASEAMRASSERLALVKEGPRKQEIEAARAALSRAQAALKLSEVNRLEVRRKEQELVTRRADLERARAQVSVVDRQLDDATLTAPIDGVVLVKAAEPGEVLGAGLPVVTIGDLARPWLRAYISEQQLGRVKLGDSVQITTDSFPGKTYNGKVTFIASEAEFTPKQIQTAEERVKLVYRIKVEVDNPNQELKINMPVDAVIGRS